MVLLIRVTRIRHGTVPRACLGRRARFRRDDALVRRAVLGDRDAFADLVVRHGPVLFRYAIRMLGDAGDAEDVVQDTFVRAWMGLARATRMAWPKIVSQAITSAPAPTPTK